MSEAINTNLTDAKYDYEYDDCDGEDDACPECGDGYDPELWQSACIDDLCHGGEVPCMHGSYARLPCSTCGK